METLIKVDPERHMYRWYSVGIQNTLVDGIAVVYGWGSLKSAFQQWRTIQVMSHEEGKKIIAKMRKSKLSKGYIQINSRIGETISTTTLVELVSHK